MYGIGGVGKTTILKKINNKFLISSLDFDVVMWVVIFKPPIIQKVQEIIWNQLDIQNNKWKSRSKYEKVAKIFIDVLLFNDIWESLDLLKVGIHFLNNRNNSKIVFTTLSFDVCQDIEAHKSFKVECLVWDEDFTLFRTKVGEDTLNSHPYIPKLLEIIAKECKCLP